MPGLSITSSGGSSQWAHEAVRLRRRATKAGRQLARGGAPLLAKALPTAVGYGLGDVVTQLLGPVWPADPWPSKHTPSAIDPSKTLLMAGAGAAVGAPASLAFYAVADSLAPGSGRLLVAAKFAADQALGCLLWQASYMAASEPYRRTFAAFAAAQHERWQQQQQQQHGQ